MEYKCIQSTDDILKNCEWKEPLKEQYIDCEISGTTLEISLEGHDSDIYINWKYTDDMEYNKQMPIVRPSITDNIAHFVLEHPYNFDIEIDILIYEK